MKIKDETCHDEDTLFKVHRALQKLGYNDRGATDIVTAILNEGILFRERVWDNEPAKK